MLTILVVVAVLVTVWIGLERRRPDDGALPGATVAAVAVAGPR